MHKKRATANTTCCVIDHHQNMPGGAYFVGIRPSAAAMRPAAGRRAFTHNPHTRYPQVIPDGCLALARSQHYLVAPARRSP